MGRLITIILALVVLAGIGALAFAYYFGGPRVERDANVFISALGNCTPFEQEAWVPMLRSAMGRAVVGPEGANCVMTMEGLGGESIRCTLNDADKALMLQFVRDGAETVTFFGGQTASLSYSSDNPDPLTQLLNGPNCTVGQ